MKIRKSTIQDLDEILAIYAYARQFMRDNGNPNQWKDTEPSYDRVLLDIKQGKSYVVEEEKEILGTFFFDIGSEPTYQVIDGAWLNDRPYGFAHRVASAKGTKGVATFALNWVYEQCDYNMRIDTHEDNKPMQGLLKKLGFEFCGIITLGDGSLRRAYQRCE
ncbi:MAG: GNAT family N-acetyltransferase [Lachnospiraceae bacterium]|nr:GNAT family N-acetyltransferase [Lachnospiraceae bacterium]